MEHKFNSGFTVEHDEFDSSYNQLQDYAKDKAKEIVSKLSLKPGDFGSFGVWTKGVPELICIADFKCNPDGSVIWNFDDSQSTL